MGLHLCCSSRYSKLKQKPQLHTKPIELYRLSSRLEQMLTLSPTDMTSVFASILEKSHAYTMLWKRSLCTQIRTFSKSKRIQTDSSSIGKQCSVKVWPIVQVRRDHRTQGSPQEERQAFEARPNPQTKKLRDALGHKYHFCHNLVGKEMAVKASLPARSAYAYANREYRNVFEYFTSWWGVLRCYSARATHANNYYRRARKRFEGN